MIATGRNGFLLLLVLVTATQLRAAFVTLQWDPSPSPRVAGYYINCALRDQPESVRLDAGRTTSAIVDNLISGRAYHFYVTAYDTNGNQSEPSNFIIWSDSDAKFVQSDNAMRGNWKGAYGSEGFWMAGAPSSLPTYGALTTSTPQWIWGDRLTSLSALLLPGATPYRIAACWYSTTQAGFDFSITDRQLHRVSFYFLDPTFSGRQQRIEIINRDTGVVLDSRLLTSFPDGIYMTWDITGNVSIRLTPLTVNAVVSAVFFDRVPTSARFKKIDTATGGDWKGVYGRSGYWIVGAPPFLPTYATLKTSSPQWIWAAQATSRSFLALPGATSDRIAACWYSATQVGFDFSVNDGRLHPISLYFLDPTWSGRQQRIDVINRDTGAMLDSRTLVGFSGGVYLTWEFTGNVSIRLTPLTVNSVASGIFFD